MPLNAPAFLRNDSPEAAMDECLSRAFSVVLREGVPDRFAVLLEALSRKGSDHDPGAMPPA